MSANPYTASIRRPWGEFAYLCTGGGPAVVFLHDVGLDSSTLRSLFDSLYPDRRCYAPDFCGHGLSVRPDRAQTVGTLARDVIELIRGQYVGKAALVGHGTGGLVALEVLRRAPDVAGRLVLLDTFLPASRREMLFGEDMIPGIYSREWQRFRATLAPWVAALREDFLITLQMYNGAEVLRESLREILFVYGGRGRSALPYDSESMGIPRRGNFFLHWLPEAGHDFPQRDPAQTGEILRRYLIDESTDFSPPPPPEPDDDLPPPSLGELMFTRL